MKLLLASVLPLFLLSCESGEQDLIDKNTELHDKIFDLEQQVKYQTELRESAERNRESVELKMLKMKDLSASLSLAIDDLNNVDIASGDKTDRAIAGLRLIQVIRQINSVNGEMEMATGNKP